MARCSTKDARSCQYPSGLFIEKAWNDGNVCGQDRIFIELSWPTDQARLLGKDLTGLFCDIKSPFMARCSTKDARSCKNPSGLFIEKVWNDGDVCGQDGIIIE